MLNQLPLFITDMKSKLTEDSVKSNSLKEKHQKLNSMLKNSHSNSHLNMLNTTDSKKLKIKMNQKLSHKHILEKCNSMVPLKMDKEPSCLSG